VALPKGRATPSAVRGVWGFNGHRDLLLIDARPAELERDLVQRLVDRRFNRARYDGEATVAALTARLCDAVEVGAIRADLPDAVTRAVEPSHASVWIKP
jgi:hypothetical protein